jgi:hypothetical protein
MLGIDFGKRSGDSVSQRKKLKERYDDDFGI